MIRVLNGLTGIVLIIIGLGALVAPVIYHPVYRVNLDLSNVKWPFALVSISFGIVCLYLAISKKNSKKNSPWICSKCEDIVYLKFARKDNFCKLCGANLEKLEGFYERHPDKK